MKLNNHGKLISNITKNKSNINLTIGINNCSNTSLSVFGNNGEKLDYDYQRYEIGSLTKVFTATLLAKYLTSGQVDLDSSANCYLPRFNLETPLPSIKQLATHTSSYNYQHPFTKIEYLTVIWQVLVGGKNPLAGEKASNHFYNTLNKTTSKNKSHKFNYGNMNYSLLGYILAELEKKPYPTVMEAWLQNELGLSQTNFKPYKLLPAYNILGQKSHNWLWEEGDEALAAAGLYSTASDLLAFAAHHNADKTNYFTNSHQVLTSATRTHDMALGWKKTKEHPILWHNGGTGCFSSFLGFNTELKKEVVILSNYRSSQLNQLGLSLLS